MEKPELKNNEDLNVGEESVTPDKKSKVKKSFDYNLAVASGVTLSDYLLCCKIAGIYDWPLVLVFSPLVISLLAPVVCGVVAGYKEHKIREEESKKMFNNFVGMIFTYSNPENIEQIETENVLKRENDKQN